MDNLSKIALIFLFLIWHQEAFTSIKKNPFQKSWNLIQGGEAGRGFSLLKTDIKRKKKREQIKIFIGDLKGKKVSGSPGYFISSKQKNIINIDFFQTSYSKFSERTLNKLLSKNSKFIKKGFLSLDPEDQSMNLQLVLNNNVWARVFPSKNSKKASYVVVELARK